MARKITLVSDLTGNEITDHVEIVLDIKGGDRYTLDADRNDRPVQEMMQLGRKAKRRGRVKQEEPIPA